MVHFYEDDVVDLKLFYRDISNEAILFVHISTIKMKNRAVFKFLDTVKKRKYGLVFVLLYQGYLV